MRRLSNEFTHPHLISLLCTYEQDGSYHLVFPWAKTDLYTYWRTSRSWERNDGTLPWLAKQCEGIAEGLSYIHHHLTYSGTSLVHQDSRHNLTKEGPQQGATTQHKYKSPITLFGRHGDIKPENILWFRENRKNPGILKLADFGVANFSTKDESQQDFDSSRHKLTASTPTYRSPENDFKDLPLGSSYDIWSLGCVYLEFIAWWFGHWKLVYAFAEERKADDRFWSNYKGLTNPIKLDTFFEIQEKQAFVKPCVSNVSLIIELAKKVLD